MTSSQRTVLALGAFVIIGVLLTTPSYQYGVQGMVYAADYDKGLGNVWNWQTALVRSTIVAAITGALYLAAGNRKDSN